MKTIFIDRIELIEALRLIASQIYQNCPEVKSVRLFGSLARGDQVGTSDVDILIVQHHSDLADPLQEARRYYPFFDLPIGVDLIVATREQIDWRLSEGDPWVIQIWKESLPL